MTEFVPHVYMCVYACVLLFVCLMYKHIKHYKYTTYLYANKNVIMISVDGLDQQKTSPVFCH